jgi:hypothetical protein
MSSLPSPLLAMSDDVFGEMIAYVTLRSALALSATSHAVARRVAAAYSAPLCVSCAVRPADAIYTAAIFARRFPRAAVTELRLGCPFRPAAAGAIALCRVDLIDIIRACPKVEALTIESCRLLPRGASFGERDALRAAAAASRIVALRIDTGCPGASDLIKGLAAAPDSRRADGMKRICTRGPSRWFRALLGPATTDVCVFTIHQLAVLTATATPALRRLDVSQLRWAFQLSAVRYAVASFDRIDTIVVDGGGAVAHCGPRLAREVYERRIAVVERGAPVGRTAIYPFRVMPPPPAGAAQ